MQILKNNKSIYIVQKVMNANILLINIGKLAACIFVFVFAASSCKSRIDEVTIDGNIKELADSKIYLHEFFGDSIQIYDSIKINKKGFFKYHTSINSPKIILVTNKNQTQLFSLLIFPTENIQIKSTLSDLSDLTIYGSKGSILINQLNHRLNTAKEKLDSLSNIYSYYKNDLKFDSIKIELEKSSKQIFESHKNYSVSLISSNVYSPISILTLFQKYDSMHSVFNHDSDFRYFYLIDTALLSVYPELPIVKSFHKKVVTIESIKDLKRERNLMIKKGDLFPDIPLTLTQGEEFRITGRWFRLLLINFNADNCSKCLKTEELISLFREYDKKGLMVINIQVNNTLNNQSPLFDTLGFYNAVINSSSNNKILDTLNISSLPANFLTDRWSTIREANLTINELRQKMKEMLP